MRPVIASTSRAHHAGHLLSLSLMTAGPILANKIIGNG
jgi:hypothetical protein